MKANLKRKTTRTVHGDKVVRLRIDIPFDNVTEEGGEGQDVHEWLDHKVDDTINFEILPFNDDDQQSIEEMMENEEFVEEI